jgi:nicotinate-nucleotide adenylyltransferase
VSGGGGIGVFGGSFNPIHLAHLRAAEEVREAERLDEVRFVPTALPPHKEPGSLVTAAHRLRMVELAIAGVPGFTVSTIELRRAGVSYSIDTLRAFRAELGDAARIVFVVGYDAFRDFHTWREHDAIFGICDVIVVTRPPGPTTLVREEIPLAAREAFWYDSGSESFRHRSGHVLRLQRITALDISAASIRARLAAGRSIRFLVPSAVEAYVMQHGLYGQEDLSR